GATQAAAGPPPETDPVALEGVIAEGRRRRERAEKTLAGAPDEAGTRELAALAEIFGADFRALPLVPAPNGSALRDAISESAALGPAPVTSLVVHAPPALDPAQPVAGLVVDEWPELVPAAELATGIAFHADAPGARPPQTILLAVHPDPQHPWSSAILADVV